MTRTSYGLRCEIDAVELAEMREWARTRSAEMPACVRTKVEWLLFACAYQMDKDGLGDFAAGSITMDFAGVKNSANHAQSL